MLLSQREAEVAILLSKGLINKEIADRLNISLTTVISHRKNIMDKLHARSLADIIIYVVMNNLADISEL
jgi:DNA-binding NarL/FixJ family response regulator